MSTISKVAVYDARLQQEEPAYAVQKGALSVSVAPFQAISANSSQMTFQVLVPSLNVFVDRKLQLSTGLFFTANLFYGGPRSLSSKGYILGAASALGQTDVIGETLSITNAVTINNGAATTSTLPVGTRLYQTVTGKAVPPNTFITGAFSSTVYSVNNTFEYSTASGIGLELPMSFDVPDPLFGVNEQVVGDLGYSNAYQGEKFLQPGFCTAVSAKDLSLVSFPVQSSLSNMTATLNDCTVTTNGDTLREQILLTMARENTKQRTCPTNTDVFSWGRDDALNGSGNFSSYSVVDAYGDIPNGAYPIQYYADASQALVLTGPATKITPLKVLTIGGASTAGTSRTDTNGTLPDYPFLPSGGAVYSFGLDTNPNIEGPSSCGFYIATPSTQVSGAVISPVVVPFVNGQPVWTTGFPGGDLISIDNTYTTPALTGASPDPGFALTKVATGAAPATTTPRIFSIGDSVVITLLRDVPPYCMIGARLYATGNSSTYNGGGSLVAGAQPKTLAFVSSLFSGALGQKGSQYNIVTGSALFLDSNATPLAIGGNFSLSAGFKIFGPMPVFGGLQVTEPLVISPLIWADSAEFQSVGLYGMTNMQFVLNFAVLGTCFAQQNAAVTSLASNIYTTIPYWIDDLTRPTNNTGNILRSSNIRSVISDLAFGQSTNQLGPWVKPTLFVGFLTPGPDITLPLVSTVPYVEFPRYVTTVQPQGTFAGAQVVQTNTISLTSIPDMVMLYVKPATKGPSQLDQYIPIQNVTVTFDNFSNLCSGFQQFNLYESAVAAGLDMDWHQWRGYTQAAYPSLARVTSNSAVLTAAAPVKYRQTGVTQLSGGPILLRMGHDITLSPGLAPGCLGNYSIQANLTTSNAFGFYDSLQAVTITLIAINTGFFETVRGQSAIRKTILNSADVEAATPEEGMTKTHLNRMVGRGGMGHAMGTHVMKAISVARKAHKAAKRFASMMPSGSNAASAMDMGSSGKRMRTSGL